MCYHSVKLSVVVNFSSSGRSAFISEFKYKCVKQFLVYCLSCLFWALIFELSKKSVYPIPLTYDHSTMCAVMLLFIRILLDGNGDV